MDTRDAKQYSLSSTRVFICPACGVVNPAGPSEGCPHLQVVRFDGVPEALEDLIMEVAQARRQFNQQAQVLKRVVMGHVQDGSAIVETPRRANESEVAGMYAEAGRSVFVLSHPDGPDTARRKRVDKKKGQRRAGAAKQQKSVLKGAQLDLLAYSPPKGNA